MVPTSGSRRIPKRTLSSSGEAELHGINPGITQGLGLQPIAKDLGFDYKIRMPSDAAAALGACCRRSLGKARNLDVADLRAQDRVRTGFIELIKVLGSEYPAEIMTKYTDRPISERMLTARNMVALTGRASCAPAAARC